MNNTTRTAIATAAIASMLFPLAACGNTTATSSSGKTKLTVWSWDTSIDRAAEAFMKANPDITVKVSNVGSTDETYTALNNASQAGSGLPDVTLIEYLAVPQFVHSGTLRDLSDLYDTAKLKKTFTPGTWNSVNINGGLYAMPADSGPMAYFYNKDVFDKAGISEPPTTWDEFYEDAKKVRATGSYITSDSGDAGLFNAMMWAMGGQAYKVDGENLTIDVTGDKGAQRFMDLWQKMRDEDLIDVHTKTWTDDWMKSLGDGSVASLISGAWMANNLLQGVPQATGKFRVALLPTVDGSTVNAEYGGSGLAITKEVSDSKLDAAKKFVEYVTTSDEGIDVRVSNGSFPATTATLNQKDFLDKTTLKNSDGSDNEFFGGQKYNEVFSQAAENVTGKWEFLPFEPYARSIYNDYMGSFFSGKSDIKSAAAKWQKAMKDYAKDQGFTVK
ncbi:sugar ABC transporter substrate-binding protein [Bifidobacterium sp. CP2]|uniref:ABC transporter substrate-binding protein n=1 Tax=Bifidobacterium TaxID=1678 RepID=UPI001BDC9789|nr:MULTISPECIES: sugar ABC transporter substrate-binding protein [Bifidobacterium]MBT1181590.1 sugar ABC transporter substrate-binding protein [Bifidobacterium sp. CP2]MBW3081678.1 sugar ABC transporter substrate-binding protein [Bifidobacterium saguinibicoloris]